MKIDRLEEFAIKEKTKIQIGSLLKSCFSDYPSDRIYYKQIPSFRYLVWDKKQLIAHMAVEHRYINIGATIASIFGVVDLCVRADAQNKKIASKLLEELEKLANASTIDFIVLVAKEKTLYLKNGFQSVDNTCKWLLIINHQTIGVRQRKIGEDLMIKVIGKKKWNDGIFDYLGHVF